MRHSACWPSNRAAGTTCSSGSRIRWRTWPATQSQLYGELNKLADAGLIEVGDIGPRGRKEYRVTEAGRQDLLRWLTDPGADPPFRSAGLLRIFLLGEMPPTGRGSTSRRSRAMPTPSWPATRRCATPSRGAKATRTSTPGRRWSSVSAGRRWRPTGPGGYSRRLTADPPTERCIAIVSDISLPYRKRVVSAFCRREKSPWIPHFPISTARSRASPASASRRPDPHVGTPAGTFVSTFASRWPPAAQDGPGRLRPGFGFGPGFGPGSGFGPGGRGGRRGHGRGQGRRGDVRAAILALLAERPMHGYEMIQEIAERTDGVWKPSPGSVYPTCSCWSTRA